MEYTPSGVAMSAKHIYVSDKTWFETRYYEILWVPPQPVLPLSEELPISTVYQRIMWPLPQGRIYEIVTIGDTTYVLLRASAFVADTKQEEEAL